MDGLKCEICRKPERMATRYLLDTGSKKSSAVVDLCEKCYLRVFGDSLKNLKVEESTPEGFNKVRIEVITRLKKRSIK